MWWSCVCICFAIKVAVAIGVTVGMMVARSKTVQPQVETMDVHFAQSTAKAHADVYLRLESIRYGTAPKLLPVRVLLSCWACGRHGRGDTMRIPCIFFWFLTLPCLPTCPLPTPGTLLVNGILSTCRTSYAMLIGMGRGETRVF